MTNKTTVHLPDKPYDIKQRTFEFGCAVIAAFPTGYLNRPALKVWSQLIDSSTSTGAHVEEAFAAGTRPHFISLYRGGLREIRESHYWIRVLIHTKLTGYEQVKSLLPEANELVSILTSIVKNFQRGSSTRKTP